MAYLTALPSWFVNDLSINHQTSVAYTAATIRPEGVAVTRDISRVRSQGSWRWLACLTCTTCLAIVESIRRIRRCLHRLYRAEWRLPQPAIYRWVLVLVQGGSVQVWHYLSGSIDSNTSPEFAVAYHRTSTRARDYRNPRYIVARSVPPDTILEWRHVCPALAKHLKNSSSLASPPVRSAIAYNATRPVRSANADAADSIHLHHLAGDRRTSHEFTVATTQLTGQSRITDCRNVMTIGPAAGMVDSLPANLAEAPET